MKFACSVLIRKPRDFVVSKFQDPSNLAQWQDGFLGIKHLTGEPGKDNSTAEMKYKMGRNTIYIHETVLSNQLPDSFYGEYASDHTLNTMYNSFEVVDANTTRYIAEVEYLEFNGFMINVMKTIMPSMFKKQVQKWLDQFKVFVEQ